MVSIITPVHNGARFLEEAVRSVILQTYTGWELLIINDGSTDETAAIAQRLAAEDGRICLLNNETNLGIQKTLNRGLREAKGDYVARIDDDDIWADPEKLAKQVAFLDSHPDYVLVGTGVIEIDESGRELFRFLQPETDSSIRAKILRRNCFTHSSVMFRAAAVREASGYGETEETRHIEDYDLWLRIGNAGDQKYGGKFANLPIYGVKFRLRPGSLSIVNKIDQFRKDLALIKKYGAFYPHAWISKIYARARLWAYAFYGYLPEAVRHLLLNIYRKT